MYVTSYAPNMLSKQPYSQIIPISYQIVPIYHQIMMANRENLIIPLCHQKLPRILPMRRIHDEQRDAHEMQTRCMRHDMRGMYHQKTSARHLMSQERCTRHDMRRIYHQKTSATEAYLIGLLCQSCMYSPKKSFAPEMHT